jgi:hypothetical protein
MQRLLRHTRSLTAGEITVVRHLLQQVIDQRHYSGSVYTYSGRPNREDPFVACRFTGRQYRRSVELARRAWRWEQQLVALRVYHHVCHSCRAPYGRYVRLFLPLLSDDWPPGVTFHVAFDPTAADYPAVRREVGRRVSDPHLIVSDDLERLHAVLIM